ncbi:MAG: choice-of-anchor tandem repeat GloVer-containing protein [Chthoniobacterales bacterium]
MKNSSHKNILAKIPAQAAFRFTTAVLLFAGLAALPQLVHAQTPTLTVLHNFDGGPSSANAEHGLVQASDGNFYGTTASKGTADLGTVFQITPTGTFTVLVNFTGANGQNPECALVQGSDGLLYGTTLGGGPLPTDNGTIFKMTTGGDLQTLFAFPLTNGSEYLNGRQPAAGMALGSDGAFYGTNTLEGMRSPSNDFGNGTVFKISSGGAFQTLFTFHSSNVAPNFEGAGPQAPLVLDADGSFYSTTHGGGQIGDGTIFRVTASGVKTELFEFTDTTGGPEGGLVLGPDNKYYGTTERGGSSNLGSYYRISHAGVFEMLGSFTGAANGGQPFGEMVVASDGNLYGTTYSGGSGGVGTIFRLTTAGVLTTVYSFPNSEQFFGAFPKGPLIQGKDGALYGTTTGGGATNAGVVFRLDLNPKRLLNISTRLNVQIGDNVLIGGFIITGTQPKQVIVRAIGPSLGKLGVVGALADTVLELHEPDGTVITNDNWKDTQEAEIAATNLAPSNNLESAILATLDPGAYTAIVSGKNSGTGIALVEAYDLDQTVDSQLANISTRGLVETGDNVMIGGFIVGGDTATIALRAIGPSLTDSGVMGALADPFLELHNGDGDIVDSNDNWMDNPDKQTFIDDNLAPTNDKESIVLGTLAPGAYTAIVQGADGGTGVGLVEAYNISP